MLPLKVALLFVMASSAGDDRGETPETVTLLELGGPPLPGSLAGRSDVDVFRLDVAGRASVEVRTSGQTDTRGELLDGGGARLASDDNSGPGADNFIIEADLEPGIYYIEVSGEGGGYAISAAISWSVMPPCVSARSDAVGRPASTAATRSASQCTSDRLPPRHRDAPPFR